MTCGEPPAETIARASLESSSERGISLNKYQNKATMQGLALKSENRIQNMDIFRSVIYNLPMPEEVICSYVQINNCCFTGCYHSIIIIIKLTSGFNLGNDIRYSPYDDGFHVRGFSYESENINIPSRIAGLNVTQIDDGAFRGYKELHDIDVPGTINTIGRFAFNGCMNLSGVTLAEGVKKFCLSHSVAANHFRP